MNHDPLCDGEVSLVARYKGIEVAKVGRCSQDHTSTGECRTRVVLLTVLGQTVEVDVRWGAPSRPATPDHSPAPPAQGASSVPPAPPPTWRPPGSQA